MFTFRLLQATSNWEPDTSATGQFGTKTLRHHKIGAEVSGHFGTKSQPLQIEKEKMNECQLH